MKKKIVDDIILRNQVQPIGNGYIDLVVHPNNIRNFLNEIINTGLYCSGVSWWEYCENDISEAKFGIGWPKSIYYHGYIAEIPISDIDHFEESNTVESLELFIKNKK